MYVPSGAEIVIEGCIMNEETHGEMMMVEMLRTYDFK